MTNDRPIVLVTGATGFVARHLMPVLERNGWATRAAVRRQSGLQNEVVVDSIGAGTDWQAALAGVDAVVHLAARVHHPNDRDAEKLYRDLNLEGTLQLARCAVAAGVKQFVFASTALVFGRNNDDRPPFNEDDVLMPRSPYSRSKVEAEAGLKSLAQGHAMRVTVVRPPLVYGAGAKGNFALLARAAKVGVPLPFAAIRNRRAFVSVQNLASFIASRLSALSERFDVFLVADAEQVSTPEFFTRLARAAGRKAHLFAVPETLLGSLLTLSGRPDARQSLIGSLELDISKALSTGWRPPLTLDEGLRVALSAPEA
jgi:nucleoside-diphosphate-sugar epimerase